MILDFFRVGLMVPLEGSSAFSSKHLFFYSRDFLIGSNGILGRFMMRIRLFLELMLRNLES